MTFGWLSLTFVASSVALSHGSTRTSTRPSTLPAFKQFETLSSRFQSGSKVPMSALSPPSAPPCSCQGDISQLNAQVSGFEQPEVDQILSLTQQAIEYWSNLRACQRCVPGRLHELLDIYNSIVDMLMATAELFRLPSPNSAGSADGEASESATSVSGTFAARQLIIAQPLATTTAAPTSRVIPPMAIGEFRLDHDQSLCLLRSVYHGLLDQLASVLYEMRQDKGDLCSSLGGGIGDVLYRVLSLIESVK